MDEAGPSPVPHKKAFVYHWVKQNAKPPQEHAISSNRFPPTPPGDRTKNLPSVPQWQTESKRGKSFARLFTPSSLRIM
ncbi:hypothetical protein B0H12DRAFT_1134837 [Mycena haematopus]|nr:hypothetical protein B0H12DRAFT_1134837 [Mycena haematopus]